MRTYLCMLVLAILATMASASRQESQKTMQPAALVQFPKGITIDTISEWNVTHNWSLANGDFFDSPAGPNRSGIVVPINLTSPGGAAGKLVRENILHMSYEKRVAFLKAVNLLKTEMRERPGGINSTCDKGMTWNTWDYLAYMHTNISLTQANIASGVMFLPWHRQWLMLYDKELQRVSGDTTMTLPYWDWSNREEAMKVFTDQFMGGNGTGNEHYVKNGPFGAWKQKINYATNCLCPGGITREIGINTNDTETFVNSQWISTFGLNTTIRSKGSESGDNLSPQQKHTGTLPSPCDVLEGLSLTTFYRGNDFCRPTFAMALSYLHIEIHRMIGGDMNLGAANDPILLIHHAFVDKLWLMWQKAHRRDSGNTSNAYGFPDGMIDEHMMWVGGTPSDVLKWEELSYVYEADDTIDAEFIKYFKRGKKDEDMCKAWQKQIGTRLLGNFCHQSP